MVRVLKCLMFLSLLLLYGCFEVEFHIQIQKDGTEIGIVKLILPAMFKNKAGEPIAEMKKEGFSVTTESKGENFIIIGTQKFLKGEWEFPRRKDVSNDKFTPSYNNYFFVKFYSLDASFTIPANEEIPIGIGHIPLRYFIQLPGKISNHNAPLIKENELCWEYNLATTDDENVHIQASSYEINYLAIALTCIPLIFVFLIFALKPLYRKKINTISTPPPLPTPSPPIRPVDASPSQMQLPQEQSYGEERIKQAGHFG